MTERDDFEGAAAKIKNVVRLDPSDTDAQGFVRKTHARTSWSS